MYPRLQKYIERALEPTNRITAGRKRALEDLAEFVSSRRVRGETAQLTFICTHNSRRSQMAQLWAAAAAAHFGAKGVLTHSGGTEVTAFDRRAVAAMERAGFVIEHGMGSNPRHRVTYAKDGPVIECYSKAYDDPGNPAEGFAAVMTCSEADRACPVVVGAALRVPLAYEDPKVADGTPAETLAYDERSLQLATDVLYLFSRVS